MRPLEKQRERGDVYYRQEFMCEFGETGRFLMDEKLIKGMVKRDEVALE
jgi:hypothetical protein